MEKSQLTLQYLEQQLDSLGSFVKRPLEVAKYKITSGYEKASSFARERPLEALGSTMLFTGLPMFLTRIICYATNTLEPFYTVSEVGKYLAPAGAVSLVIGLHLRVKRKQREIQELQHKKRELEIKAQEYGYQV